jgi:hypothetical protein
VRSAAAVVAATMAATAVTMSKSLDYILVAEHCMLLSPPSLPSPPPVHVPPLLDESI